MLQAYGNGELFGEAFGDGPVQVLWLHGWDRRGSDFARPAAILADAGVASVALDMPGFGASPPPHEVGGARRYAELLLPVIRDLSPEPLFIVGHSFGGRVAVSLAAAHPEVVGSLVLTGVPLLRQDGTRQPVPAYRLIRWLHRRGLIGERRMEQARQKYGSPDYRNARGAMRDVLVICVNESYEEELQRITCPVVLLWGEGDGEAPVQIARRARELLKGPSSLRVLSGVGHLVPTIAPEELAKTVLQSMTR
ncbi:MAG: alpha/beta hydrolase [Acidimicrobiaceae bacterium]|nr:alpha/beta hydrolase [Acidimicrobiaceae bacterium]